MNPFLPLAFLLALPFQLDSDSDLFVNSFYHVVCLAGQIDCNQEGFEDFWHDELQWGDEDEESLGVVKSVMKRLDDAAPAPEAVPVPPNFSGYYPGYRARYSALDVILTSGSVPAIGNALAESMALADAQRLAAAFGHFEVRLRPWWNDRDTDSASKYGLEVVARAQSAGLADLAGQMGDFLEAPVDRAELHSVIAPYDGKGKNATIMGRHLFIDFSAEDTTTDGAWKAFHELSHILYDNGPISRHQDLLVQFLAAKQPHSISHYALLNEGIATAAQLIAFEKLNLEMEDFYADAFIPRVARATQPLLTKALATGATLYSGFAEDYMLAADKELGDEVRRPQYMLISVVVLGTERHPDASGVYFELIPPRSVSTSRDSAEVFFEANVVWLLTHSELGSMKEVIPLGPSDAQRRGFVFSPPPTSKKRVYLISGQTDEDLVEAVRRFAELADVTPSGFLVAFD